MTRRRKVFALLGTVVAAATLAGCAYDNGQGGTSFVPPPPEVVAKTGPWYYAMCVSPGGCIVNGTHYGQWEMVPVPSMFGH